MAWLLKPSLSGGRAVEAHGADRAVEALERHAQHEDVRACAAMQIVHLERVVAPDVARADDLDRVGVGADQDVVAVAAKQPVRAAVADQDVVAAHAAHGVRAARGDRAVFVPELAPQGGVNQAQAVLRALQPVAMGAAGHVQPLDVGEGQVDGAGGVAVGSETAFDKGREKQERRCGPALQRERHAAVDRAGHAAAKSGVVEHQKIATIGEERLRVEDRAGMAGDGGV